MRGRYPSDSMKPSWIVEFSEKNMVHMRKIAGNLGKPAGPIFINTTQSQPVN